MNLGLRLLEKRDLPQYKADMQGAFQLGAQEGGCFADGRQDRPQSGDGGRARRAAGRGAVHGGEDRGRP